MRTRIIEEEQLEGTGNGHEWTGMIAKVSKTFRLDAVTLRQVEKLAKEQNRTVNNMVETMLMEWFKKNPQVPVVKGAKRGTRWVPLVAKKDRAQGW